MVEIGSSDDLRAWLRERSREDAVAIAARAALRALPLVVRALPGDPESGEAAKRRAAIVLPVFRATAAPRVAAIGPTRGAEVRNAADAAAAAADAADAAADAAADVWKAVSADATALEQGRTPAQVVARPLWPDAPPEAVAGAWTRLRQHLTDANEGWEVWTEWYDGCLHGGPFDTALEEARVLIDPGLWEQGPKAVNAEIGRLIEEHVDSEGTHHALKADSREVRTEVSRPELRENDPLTAKLDAALTSVELRAALADFELDDMARLMRMVPFIEDLKHLDDPLLEKDRENKLSELADAMKNLATDIRHDAGNAPGWLRRDLGRYSKEAALGPKAVRPGHLWDIGAGLAGALKDADIEWSLGVHLFGKLERLVAKHLDLMRDYFAATLARTRPLDKIETAPDATPEAMIEALDQAVEGLDSGDWGDAPPPDPEIPAVMGDRVEELRDILDRINRTSDDRKRDDLERTFWRRSKAAAMTVMRYGARSMELTAAGYGVVAGTQYYFPAQFQTAVDTILRLLQNIPWPF